MAQLYILQDATLRNYLEAFRGQFSAPQWKYYVTVWIGLLHYNGSKTLSGTLREAAIWVTMSRLRRFLIVPEWSVAGLERVRYQQFARQVTLIVARVHQHQKVKRKRL
jgi:hypothetical protein